MLLPFFVLPIAMFLFLTNLLSALTSSVERFFSEILETYSNDIYALFRSLLLTHSLSKLVASKLVIYLNSISKCGKYSEYSIVFGGMTKLKSLHFPPKTIEYSEFLSTKNY